MKKFLLIILAAITIVSCQKKETETTTPQFQDVTFKAIEVSPDNGLKNTADYVCAPGVDPTNALVEINGTSYFPELFKLDGVLYTQAIKLPVLTAPDEYCVETFVLYQENGTEDGVQTGDIIVFGTPASTSDYATYVDYPLEYCIPLEAFVKNEIPIEVLCFDNALYTDFGFDWFQITEIVIRQFCFFGDICITDDNAAAFAGSIYDTDGLTPDEEANFQIIVKSNGFNVPYGTVNNTGIYGQGEALCVDYPDNLSNVDNFTFELQVWVPSTVPGTFVWQTYATFTSIDDGNLFYDDPVLGDVDLGDNTTVKSFAIGTCSPDSYPIFTWLDPITPGQSSPCDDGNAVWGNALVTPSNGYNTQSGFKCYQQFLGASGDFSTVTFWISGYVNPPDDPRDFLIEIYEDNANTPGSLVSSTTANLYGFNTGELVVGLPIWQYTAQIPVSNLVNGFISVEGIGGTGDAYWVNTLDPAATGVSIQVNGVTIDGKLAVCLGGVN